jgi:hypothetical protein
VVVSPITQPDHAEGVALALVQGEGDDEAFPIRRQLGDRGDHPKIGIATAQIEAAQQIPVEGQAIRIIGVRGREYAPESGFRGCDLFP